MSARTLHTDFVSPGAAFASTPFFLPTSRTVVPTGQAYAKAFSVVEATENGPFTTYPPPTDDTDKQLLHTYASFREEPVASLPVHAQCHGQNWTLAIEVPIPPINNPTLLALNYMIKYATTSDDGNSTIQTDLILTTEELPEGVIVGDADLQIYTDNTSYAPRMVKHDAALCLSTTLAIKCNGGGENWSHYVDNLRITPNVRVVGESHLYLVFNASEYPTLRTVRSLAVQVSATWQKEEVELKVKAEAERKAAEEAERQAQKEAEKKARHDEERQEREQAKAAREEEGRARNEERQDREDWKAWRDKQRDAKPSVADAPDVADDKMQATLAEAMDRLGIEKCSGGLAYVKTNWGYQCTSGSHSITFEQLGMK